MVIFNSGEPMFMSLASFMVVITGRRNNQPQDTMTPNDSVGDELAWIQLCIPNSDGWWSNGAKGAMVVVDILKGCG